MSQTTFSPVAERLARRILVVAVAIQIAMFVSAARYQFRALVSRDAVTRPHIFGSAVNGIDCTGYYAWLRSLLVDGDWQFDNEYRFYRAHWPGFPDPEPRTPTGRSVNQWSIGPAIAWSVTVVPVHVVLSAAGAKGEEPHGFSPPYQLAVGAATLALSLATLLFLYRIARVFAPPPPAAAAAAVTVLASSLVAYGSVGVAMAHGPAAAALAGCVCLWVRTFGSTGFGRWFAVGALLGAACTMRWQLATFALLPGLEAVFLACSRRPGRAVALGAVAALGAVVAFAPQMVAWWIVYGRAFVNPHPTRAEWLAPSFWQVLGSPDRGLFYWTPVALVGALGLVAAARPGREGAARAGILLAAAAIQIYAIAALVDRGVSLGASFGFRLLTETVVVLVVGVAVAFRALGPRWPTALAVAAGAAVCWNLLLIYVAAFCIPGTDGGPAALASGVRRFVSLRPYEAAGWCVLSGVLAIRIRAGLREPAPDAPAAPGSPSPLARTLGRLVRRARSAGAR